MTAPGYICKCDNITPTITETPYDMGTKFQYIV